ncbi:SufD family Fe-S cluster assembly protein [Infirmifilum sp. SLHALR2]|nr:MAG: hypothetical protein B7L53_00740 [Thermofilum sp. NZ13]
MKLEEVLKVPYQPVADSPTVRYYTDWKAFDPYIENPSPPLELSWDDSLLNALGAEPTTILKPTPVAERPTFPRASSLRILSFHEHNLNSLHRLLLTDASVTVLVPKPNEGALSAHLEVQARGHSGLRVLLLSPESSRGLVTLTLNINVAPGASLKASYVVFDSRGSPSAIFLDASLGENASMENLIIAARSRMLHLEAHADLAGANSRLSTRALLASNKGSKLALVTDAEARAPEAELDIRAVGFAGDGYIAHKGYARSRRGARGSRLRVISRLVPLTSKAKVYASPVLEIESDEPEEASHSVAQAPLDEDQIFYLRSRGFSYDEAVEALVRGAYHSLVEDILGKLELKRIVDLLVEELGNN